MNLTQKCITTKITENTHRNRCTAKGISWTLKHNFYTEHINYLIIPQPKLCITYGKEPTLFSKRESLNRAESTYGSKPLHQQGKKENNSILSVVLRCYQKYIRNLITKLCCFLIKLKYFLSQFLFSNHP